MSSRDFYETYESYQDYQDDIKLLLQLFIKNFRTIQLMHRLGKVTTQNASRFLGINYRRASLIRSLYQQWCMGDFDL